MEALGVEDEAFFDADLELSLEAAVQSWEDPESPRLHSVR